MASFIRWPFSEIALNAYFTGAKTRKGRESGRRRRRRRRGRRVNVAEEIILMRRRPFEAGKAEFRGRDYFISEAAEAATAAAVERTTRRKFRVRRPPRCFTLSGKRIAVSCRSERERDRESRAGKVGPNFSSLVLHGRKREREGERERQRNRGRGRERSNGKATSVSCKLREMSCLHAMPSTAAPPTMTRGRPRPRPADATHVV